MLGLSPDQTKVACAFQYSGLVIVDLPTKSVTQVSVDPNNYRGLNRGLNEVRFSPDNRYIAWMEFSGYPSDPVTGESTLHSQLRVKALQDKGTAKPLYDLVDTSFIDLVGFTPNWIIPVGWLDNQTLLMEVSVFYQKDAALVKMNVSDGSLTLFTPGRFADFVYGPATQ